MRRKRKTLRLSKTELKRRVRAKQPLRPVKTAQQELTDLRRARQVTASFESPSWWPNYERILRTNAKRMFMVEPKQASISRVFSGLYSIILIYPEFVNVEKIIAHRLSLFMDLCNRRTPQFKLMFNSCIGNTQMYSFLRLQGMKTISNLVDVYAQADERMSRFDGPNRVVPNPWEQPFYDGTPLRTRVGEKKKTKHPERQESASLVMAFYTLRDALKERVKKVTQETNPDIIEDMIAALMDYKGGLVPRNRLEAESLNKYIEKLYWNIRKAVEQGTESSTRQGTPNAKDNNWPKPRFFDTSPRVMVPEKQKTPHPTRKESALFRAFSKFLHRARMDEPPRPLGVGTQVTEREDIHSPEELVEFDKKLKIRKELREQMR